MVLEASISKSRSEQLPKSIHQSHFLQTQHADVFDPQGWRIKTLISKLGMGKTKIYDLIKKGQFPAPRKLGRMSIWNSLEVQAWIDEHLNGGAA